MKGLRGLFIDQAERYGMSRTNAEKFYHDVVHIMKTLLVKNKFFTIQSFGTFKVRSIPSRTIRSRIINKGRPTKTKESKAVRFKTAESLKWFLQAHR